MPIKHQHLTVIPDDPNYDVSADEWNADHTVTGGTNGDVMVRNIAVSAGWSLIPSAAGFFSCDAAGSLPSFGAGSIAVGPGQGGTGITSYAVGDLLVATGVTTLSRLAAVGVGSVLISQGLGVVPIWSALPTATRLTLASDLVVLGTPGAVPASVGMVRLAHPASIVARDAAGATDINLLVLSPANILQVGDPAHRILLNGPTDAVTLPVGTNTAQVATTAFVIQNMASVGAGNVVGAPPVVDGAVALFSGTTGHIIKTTTPDTWTVDSSGVFAPTTTNVLTIGSAALRPLGVFISQHVSIGSSSSSIGAIRLANNTGMFTRNVGNSGDLQSSLRDATNLLTVGDLTAATKLVATNLTLHGSLGISILRADGAATVYTFDDLRLAPVPDAVRELGGISNRWVTAYLTILNTSRYWDSLEIATPPAPSAGSGRLFFDNNGAGKTRLMVIFSTGAAQQVAIQP